MTKMTHEKDLESFTTDQRHCIEMLGDWACGFHHLPMPKEWGRGVRVHWTGDLSTWDFDRLTRLVLLAHKHCVRIEIGPGGPRGVAIMAHRRVDGLRSITEGHPDLEQLTKRIEAMRVPVVVPGGER